MALIILGATNGVLIKWFNAKGDVRNVVNADVALGITLALAFWSKWWHRGMLAIRCFIFLIVWFESNRSYAVTVPVIILTALEYNISINLINGLKWNYMGTTAKTDILWNKFLVLWNKFLKIIKIRWIWITRSFK